jgi:hypothetical protein
LKKGVDFHVLPTYETLKTESYVAIAMLPSLTCQEAGFLERQPEGKATTTPTGQSYLHLNITAVHRLVEPVNYKTKRRINKEDGRNKVWKLE